MYEARNPAAEDAVPAQVDLHIGRRLRRRRRLLGLTQSEVADAIGVQFQQIQKYECAAARLSAGRLYELSRALCVPVSYFYGGLHLDPLASPATTTRPQLKEELTEGETLEFAHAAAKISGRARQALLAFARSLTRDAEK